MFQVIIAQFIKAGWPLLNIAMMVSCALEQENIKCMGAMRMKQRYYPILAGLKLDLRKDTKNRR